MLKNYFVMAWRQILKNKLYAAINILGLVVGLAVFVFGILLVDYERSHDTQWSNADRIFTIGSLFGPKAGVGVSQTDSAYTAFAPFIAAEIDGVEEVARTVGREFLISINDNHYYEHVTFADPSLLKIFDFEYLEGDARALEDPDAVVLTREMATKFFGTGPVLGKVIELDHQLSLQVGAVIEDLPRTTHFRSSLLGMAEMSMLAPLQALHNAIDYDLAGNFRNLSSGDVTYMLVQPDRSRDWLQAGIDAVYEQHFPERGRDFVVGLKVRPIAESNTILWDAIGLPMLDTIRLLGFLVLVVALVNYTNLATAQSMSRGREIGLRKTMGASRAQLIGQFLVESLCMAVLAMLVALALLELLIPAFNTVMDKELAINYATTLPGLIATTIAVGILAGAYPALLITRAAPIDALRDSGGKSAKGSRFRSLMLMLQFAISIYMLAMVMVVYFQNLKIEQASQIYPRSQIISLQRLGVAAIQDRLQTLRNELMKLPGVENVSFSSQLPYLQSNSSFEATPEAGDENQIFLLSQISVDEHFLQTYDIPLLAGRSLSREIAADTIREGVYDANIVVNELALDRLGFGTPEQALGRVFYDDSPDRQSRAYTIVGVTPNQNFQGFHNEIKPTAFLMREAGFDPSRPGAYRYGSVRVAGVGLADTLTRIEDTWDDLIPGYPLQSEFLDDTFNDVYVIYNGFSVAMGGFAFIALSLSLIGLFGLAAFLAQARTKEIGIRKVMGASMGQIIRLLIWQFSRPVIWALLLALPLAYLSADMYLKFFADRIPLPVGIVGFAGLVGVFVAWSIVAVHAVKIAGANPIHALRYE